VQHELKLVETRLLDLLGEIREQCLIEIVDELVEAVTLACRRCLRLRVIDEVPTVADRAISDADPRAKMRKLYPYRAQRR
jgi:hypothetical protein